ncbi:TraR/DksA C4-type zinc finger protein [Pseudomonas aeruginosa]|uniref:TraR/DksA C4-type zinc finger protein n=1 Tax=Pseudomonas aeruginosa TaxID=287 RepID=UPI0035257AB8
MADIADRANDLMLDNLEALLAECLDCGEEIPPARQLAAPGCTLCTWCQSLSEQRGRANG